MNTSILVEAGLSEAEATTYTFLVENSPIAPPKLATLIKESRTNTYKLLESLEELGLAQKDESDKKIKYWAKNPNALMQNVKDKQEEAELKAKKIQSSLPSLVNDFLKHNEQPGVRFYQGYNGIEEIYNDTIDTCKDVYLLRSLHDQDLMTTEFFDKYRIKRAKAGITTHMLSPGGHHNSIRKLDDTELKIKRTELKKNTYLAPVEVDIYSDKVALISFGEEAIGMIIESPQIAQAMKELFKLAEKGALHG